MNLPDGIGLAVLLDGSILEGLFSCNKKSGKITCGPYFYVGKNGCYSDLYSNKF